MVIWGTELVDKSLWPVSLLHDSFSIILPQGSGELVEVHSRTVLPPAPEVGHAQRVDNLEDPLLPVSPEDATCQQKGDIFKIFTTAEPVSKSPNVNLRHSFGLELQFGGAYIGVSHNFVIKKRPRNKLLAIFTKVKPVSAIYSVLRSK